MNRNLLKAGAVVGVFSISALAAGPALAADPVSQATAQSVELKLAGNNVVSQLITATNDGKKETENNSSTVPDLASLLPNNNLAFVGVAPQEAHALVKNKKGISYACAGVAGTGGGLVKVGDSACKIGEGNKAATIGLANLDLGGQLLGDGGVLNQALKGIPGIDALLTQVGLSLSDLVQKLTNSLKLPVDLGLSLSTIEGVCTADPSSAQGDATLADAKLDANLAGNELNLVTLPANPDPNTSLTDLDKVTTMLTNALQTELSDALGGALKDINPLLSTLQSSLLTPLSKALTPLTDAIKKYLANVVLNEQTKSDGGKKIDVSAIDAKVVPNELIPGGSLISGKIGHVTCGPNSRVATPSKSPSPTPSTSTPSPSKSPDIPTNVDSGVGGNGGHANAILAAVAALLALAGAGGTMAYRRYGMPRG